MIIRTILAVGFSTVIIFGFPANAFAQNLIDVAFEHSTLFSEADFKPGDAVSRWFTVTNVSGSTLEVRMNIEPYSDPDEMGKVFDASVREQGSSDPIFSGNLWDLAHLPDLTIFNSMPPGVSQTFEMDVTFQPAAGNVYQKKSLIFDIAVAAEAEDEGSDMGGDGGETFSSGGGGGSGFLGFFEETLPGQVLGEVFEQPQELPGKVLAAVKELPRTGVSAFFLAIPIASAIFISAVRRKNRR